MDRQSQAGMSISIEIWQKFSPSLQTQSYTLAEKVLTAFYIPVVYLSVSILILGSLIVLG